MKSKFEQKIHVKVSVSISIEEEIGNCVTHPTFYFNWPRLKLYIKCFDFTIIPSLSLTEKRHSEKGVYMACFSMKINNHTNLIMLTGMSQ